MGIVNAWKKEREPLKDFAQEWNGQDSILKGYSGCNEDKRFDLRLMVHSQAVEEAKWELWDKWLWLSKGQ